ncbi:MAG: DUF134 domain-containing protein [Candidatus Saccharicenans sp.]|nr:DUF134 domain-containing protein [Candidatus Saccharicenans sp.]
MPRPFCRRRIGWLPQRRYFYPEGQAAESDRPDRISLTLDEFEAIRLADFFGLYQEEAAARMGISRATFGRILDSAHRKIAEFLIEGKMLSIEDGPVELEITPEPVPDTTPSSTPGFHPGFVPDPFARGPWSRCRRRGGIMTDKKNHSSSGRPGYGRGRGHQVGLGPEGICFCPKCGFRKPHVAGLPCREERCPQCGSVLIREGSEHQRMIEKNKGQK